MNTKQQQYYKEHIQFVTNKLGITDTQYNDFKRIANKLHTYFENDCNGYKDALGRWSEELTNKAEIAEAELMEQATEMAKDLGLFIYFQTDPRGATIYLDTQEIPENSYNNASCIY